MSSLIYSLYERRLYNQIKDGPMPSHIGIMLDGNRRWARSKGLEPWIGHRVGADKTEEILRWCVGLGIKTMTMYIFSAQNFNRPKREVDEIMQAFKEKLEKASIQEEFHKYEIRIKVLGRIHLLSDEIQQLIHKVEDMTKDYDEHFLNIAVAYGGREEIVDAVKNIIIDEIKSEEISEQIIEDYLYTSHLPNSSPDLVIRTSGEQRLSGFLPWQSAYSELVFIDVKYPELRKIDFWRAIRTYQGRSRRYGK